MSKISSEQFWKLYEKLPQELRDALFAEETGNSIAEACKRNNIGEDLGPVVDLVGQVLVGILPPEEFQETLERDLKLEKNIAKSVAHEINRFIFYPVKPVLEQLYNIGGAAGEKKPEVVPSKTGAEESPTEEKSSIPSKEDRYREPVE